MVTTREGQDMLTCTPDHIVSILDDISHATLRAEHLPVLATEEGKRDRAAELLREAAELLDSIETEDRVIVLVNKNSWAVWAQGGTLDAVSQEMSGIAGRGQPRQRRLDRERHPRPRRVPHARGRLPGLRRLKGREGGRTSRRLPLGRLRRRSRRRGRGLAEAWVPSAKPRMPDNTAPAMRAGTSIQGRGTS